MYHFIVNPTARSGYGKKVWENVSNLMKQRKLDYDVHFTQGKGDGRRLAKIVAKACEKDEAFINYVIVIGGDGTISEVLDGIWDQPQVTLGYIPVGSGNDFCRGMKISGDWKSTLNGIIEEKHIVPLYIGKLEIGELVRHFGVSCGIGFDAHVCYDVEHGHFKKWLNALHLGQFVYTFKAIRLLIMSKCHSMKIRIDGRSVKMYHNVLFAAAMNQPYEGGGFKFAPDADGTKPWLQLCVIHDVPILRRFGLFLLAPKGGIVGHKGVDILPFSKAEIISQIPKFIHYDGEVEKKGLRVTISIEETPVRFVY